jgi:hypothetical protein
MVGVATGMELSQPVVMPLASVMVIYVECLFLVFLVGSKCCIRCVRNDVIAG